jgi:hypothetical protein
MSKKHRQNVAMNYVANGAEPQEVQNPVSVTGNPDISEADITDQVSVQGDTIDEVAANEAPLIGELVTISNEKIKDMKDLGYQFSAHIDGDRDFAKWAVEHIEGFPDKVSAENVSAFKQGTLMRFTELRPSVHYVLSEGEYRVAESQEAHDFTLSVEYAVGISKHDFGILEPNKKSLVKPLRDAAKNYGDVRWSRLLKSVADLTQKSATRKSNKSFKEYIDKVFADMVPKNKRAIEAGDPTAWDNDDLRAAIAAFVSYMPGKNKKN